jgi:hypothetical protein
LHFFTPQNNLTSIISAAWLVVPLESLSHFVRFRWLWDVWRRGQSKRRRSKAVSWHVNFTLTKCSQICEHFVSMLWALCDTSVWCSQKLLEAICQISPKNP